MDAEAIERADVRYWVRVCVEKCSVTDDLTAMWEWFGRRELAPPTFRHSIRSEAIEVQLDFGSLSDASEFAGAFNGIVLRVGIED